MDRAGRPRTPLDTLEDPSGYVEDDEAFYEAVLETVKEELEKASQESIRER